MTARHELDAALRGLQRRALANQLAVSVALSLIAAAAATASLVRVTSAASVRQRLGFTFPGVPNRTGEALSIFLNNVRLLIAVMVATALVQSALAVARQSRVGASAAVVTRVLCDGALGISAVVHAVLVGAGVGAYGAQMVRVLLPHGPVELGSYSVALGTYLRARREPIGIRDAARSGLVAAIGLAVAAALETYVSA